MDQRLLTQEEFAAALRAIGAERYHNLHPFHKLLHGGKLNRGQVQAWALNRYYYQRQIPGVKDATLMARLPTSNCAANGAAASSTTTAMAPRPAESSAGSSWREGVGLERAYVESLEGLAAGDTVRGRCLCRAGARTARCWRRSRSSLTEMFSPGIIAERVEGMLRGYAFVTMDTLAYFKPRLTQAPRDSDFALAYVLANAHTREQQEAAIGGAAHQVRHIVGDARRALFPAYVEPRLVPPGAFVPKGC